MEELEKQKDVALVAVSLCTATLITFGVFDDFHG